MPGPKPINLFPGPPAALAKLLLFICLVALAAIGGPCKAGSAASSSAPTALTLYRLSLVADSRFAYIGNEFITVWRDDDLTFATATQISHLPPSKDCIVYTAPRSRRGRVILQDQNQQWTYIPQKSLVVHSVEPLDPNPPQQDAQFNLLLSNYTLNVNPKSVAIAGRKTFCVSLMPRITGLPYDKLWIDPDSGLVMRREKYHGDGSMASVSYFSEIRFHPPLTADLFSPSRWRSQKTRVVDQPAKTETKVDPHHLPPPFAGAADAPESLRGYQLQRAFLVTVGATQSLHLVYSDGLNTLSLYEAMRHGGQPTRMPESRETALAPGQPARVARRYAYSIVTWDKANVNYTLVADSNSPALVRLAQDFLSETVGKTLETGKSKPLKARA